MVGVWKNVKTRRNTPSLRGVFWEPANKKAWDGCYMSRRVGVSTNAIFFWRNNEDKWGMNGTPEDAVRKLDLLGEYGVAEHGVELILFPSRLLRSQGLPASFVREFASLPLRSVHLAEKDPQFLLRSNDIVDELRNLGRVLEALEAEHVILHADCLRYERGRIRDLLANHLPHIKVLVENTDPASRWGFRPQDLLEVYADLPEMGMCLDICHIKDTGGVKLNDFLSKPELVSRIGEIHFSYSGNGFHGDLYEARGYPGYGPFHLLWSVVDERPSAATQKILEQHPIIIEGVLPQEDATMALLHKERAIALGRVGDIAPERSVIEKPAPQQNAMAGKG